MNTSSTDKVIDIDIRKLIFVWLKRWWLIVILGFGFAGVSLLYSVTCITPMYQTSVTVYVNNSRVFTAQSSGDISAAARLVSTYINMLSSDTVLEKVSKQLNKKYSSDEIRSMLTASQVNDTEIFKVSITHSDPKEAAKIANAVAEVAPDEIQNFVGSSTKIIDYARVPTKQSSPDYVANTLKGGFVGGVLAIGILTLLYLLDVRIRTEDDLVQNFEIYPVLGQIPYIELNAQIITGEEKRDKDDKW